MIKVPYLTTSYLKELKAPVPGCLNLFVGIFAPSRMIKYIYDNQYQVFIIPKHALESYIYYIVTRNLTNLVQYLPLLMIGHVIGAWKLNR